MSKHGRLPSEIKHLDYSKLHMWQFRVLADWMGVRHQITDSRAAGGDAALKAACEANLARAQAGYEVIVLRILPKSAEKAMPGDVEAKMIDIISNLMTKGKDDLDEAARAALRQHLANAKETVNKMLADAINAAAEKARPIVIQADGKIRKIKGVMPPEFPRMVQLAYARIPIMLVGPAGCGKTFMHEKLAEAMGLPAADQSCSEGMSESVFNGLLLPTGKGGAFEHHASPFMRCYEDGGVMLLDEIDAGDPNLFTYINKAIANDSYTVVQRFEEPVVKKHKDFVLLAAANTFGHGADAMYVGRNQLDEATKDRFKVGLITMDYSRDVESSLAPTELCEWAWRIRDKIRQNKLRRIMSTRVIKDLGKMTSKYSWTVKEWEEAYFAGWSDEDRRLAA